MSRNETSASATRAHAGPTSAAQRTLQDDPALGASAETRTFRSGILGPACETVVDGDYAHLLACPCGKRMKLVGVIFEKKSLARMLAHHGISARILAVRPARPPPQTDFNFDA